LADSDSTDQYALDTEFERFSSSPFSPPATISDWAVLDDTMDTIQDDISSSAEESIQISHPSRSATPSSSLRKSKITSFWKVATPAEKAEMNSNDFQKLRDDQEGKAASFTNEAQRKLEGGRTLARARQQAHRDRSKEKKMKDGWIPGESAKRVSNLSVRAICTLR
jgi:hypothetical protein